MGRRGWKPLFSQEERQAIRERYRNEPRLSIRQIALEYNVSYNTARGLVSGEWEDRPGGRYVEGYHARKEDEIHQES